MAAEKLSVLLAGGGSAGHIEPALSVGEALRQRHGATIAAVGTSRGLESRIIPERGVELHLIDPVPIPRSKPWKLLAVPFKLFKSVKQTRTALKKTNADAVFGTGGYVSASAYVAAFITRTPFYVLETNALAGLANKLGVALGGVGLNAVEGSGLRGDVVGIPVRAGLGAQREEDAKRARELWNLDPLRPTLLVTGGSQGAASINDAVSSGAAALVDDGWQILHAYGRRNEAPQGSELYRPVPYIDDMQAALAVADLAVCRSGAMTVAEVSAMHLPAIYVPLPHGNGEQGKNAEPVVKAGGAVLVPDAEFNAERFLAEVRGAASNLASMRDNVSGSSQANVAERIADRIVSDLGL